MKVYIMKIKSLCEINFGFFYLIKKTTPSSHHFYLSYITMKENLIVVCRTILTLALLFEKIKSKDIYTNKFYKNQHLKLIKMLNSYNISKSILKCHF